MIIDALSFTKQQWLIKTLNLLGYKSIWTGFMEMNGWSLGEFMDLITEMSGIFS
ncbi:MAG: hypothetical protein ACRCTW_12390 [Lactococcus garvieae]